MSAIDCDQSMSDVNVKFWRCSHIKFSFIHPNFVFNPLSNVLKKNIKKAYQII